MSDLVQYSLALLGLLVVYLGLKRDLAGRTIIHKENAKKTISVAFIICLLSMITIKFSSIEKRKEKELSDSTSKSISNKNDSLQKSLRIATNALSIKVDNSTDTLLNEALLNSLKASKHLDRSTARIEEAVFGGKGEIHAEIRLTYDLKTFTFNVINHNKKPQYDVNMLIFDYNKLSKCRNLGDKGEWIFESNCFETARFDMPVFNLNSISEIQLPGQFSFERVNSNKFYIFISTRSYKFIQELMATKDGQAFRIFEYNEKLKIKNILKIWNPDNIKVNWGKEFQIPPTLLSGQLISKKDIF